ncbi:MAG: glucokinase [Bacteroidales bacterium]|nr:glucokinase [Bacteroidales bacterium]MDT8374489.1 glucokinase [Bacteroidales bacterium]
MILAGDIGGTKALLVLFEIKDGSMVEFKKKKYASAKYENLDTIVVDFLKDTKTQPRTAVFGIPGPVAPGTIRPPNLPWVLDADELALKTNIDKIEFVNDLAATAYSIPTLAPDDIIQIKEGKADEASRKYVVVAPGTGLGEAFLFCEGDRKMVIPSEGGHSDFAATNQMEADLYGFLAERYGHVSYERIISGRGIPNIFDFLMSINYAKPEALTLERLKTGDRAAVISGMAIRQEDQVAIKAMEIFTSVLGAHAGNLVITTRATGGVYLGGGIPHKILPLLQHKDFIDSFNDKGRMSYLTQATPVNVINNNNAALQGAAQLAFERNNNILS